MKQCKCIFLILLVVSLLAGCTDTLFVTAEYRTYKEFSETHNGGMDKQEVFNSLGSPDGYYDTSGNYHHLTHADKLLFHEQLATDHSTAWIYECHQKPDPADPYRLKISFDSEGKSTTAVLTPVAGG